ncbi:MAG: hypothetical protein E6J66_20090 [Deltaproteobacteria bacterium]|nr:MAG: hypothetical protein E6J66_20090 [Deltaproteobacteria bacterium]
MPFGLLAALLCAATEPLALPLPDHAAERAAKPRKRPGKPATTGVLNVNRATEAELRGTRPCGRFALDRGKWRE